MENRSGEPKRLYGRGRKAGLFFIAFAAIPLALAVFTAISVRGRSMDQLITGIALAALLVLAAGFFVLEGLRTFTLCVTLYEDRFTYRVFPKGERSFSYSECLSCEEIYSRFRSGGTYLYKLRMEDGSVLPVDNSILLGGLSQRLGHGSGMTER